MRRSPDAAIPEHALGVSAQFPDEASCWTYLRRVRSPHGFRCPRCGSRGSHFLSKRRLEQCCRKTGVAIAVERRARTAGAVRLAVIPRATTAVLSSFVQDSIQPQETTVFTDARGSYAALRRLGMDRCPRKGGRGHQFVHLLPWAHTVFGNLKTWLRGTFHGGSPKHWLRYLDQFACRFDRRWRETGLFIRILHRALEAAPFPRQLTA